MVDYYIDICYQTCLSFIERSKPVYSVLRRNYGSMERLGQRISMASWHFVIVLMLSSAADAEADAENGLTAVQTNILKSEAAGFDMK